MIEYLPVCKTSFSEKGLLMTTSITNNVTYNNCFKIPLNFYDADSIKFKIRLNNVNGPEFIFFAKIWEFL
jgi:hypothetical protein